jgi:hypothetical protein
MTSSRRLAELIGPTIIALAASEALNYRIFETNIAPVVYFNGTVLFVVGLAIVRAHNLWAWRWPVLITLTGWVGILAGLWRMFAPQIGRAPESGATYGGLFALGAIGIFLTLKGYSRDALSVG